MVNNLQNIGIRIKEFRDKKNLKQVDFAEKIDISQAALSAIEKGKTTSLETVIKIASAFEIDLNWLLTGEQSHGENYKIEAQNSLAAEYQEDYGEKQKEKLKTELELKDQLLQNKDYTIELQKYIIKQLEEKLKTIKS
jgi:transcriptional regulator with XRE-family HTH domain